MMSKKEAVAAHRKMWNWIADETLKRKCCVHKSEYFHFSGYKGVIPFSNCFCCQYIREHKKSSIVLCAECPIVFYPLAKTIANCTNSNSPFKLWVDSFNVGDWNLAAKYAREIAELPERGRIRMRVVDNRINKKVKYLKDVIVGEVVSLPSYIGGFYIVTKNGELVNLNSGIVYTRSMDDTLCIVHEAEVIIKE